MRLVITYVLTSALGIAIAYGVAYLIGLLFPIARLPVFAVISLWWLYNGWKHANWQRER